MPAAKPQVDLAKYLFTRLHQLGVRHVHGVPGDYNLTACDYVEASGLVWVGNANELNAGYAADGYARIKGIAALMTSFGVGELSAINAIAGAYAEKAPVVHIVGTAAVGLQKGGECLHHSLGDGNFRAFANMYKTVTAAQANLVDAATAPDLIDETLRQCLLQSQPVYIELPSDMVAAQVPAPLRAINLSTPGYDSDFEDELSTTVLSAIYNAASPLLVVDGYTARYHVRKEINELVARTGLPTLTTPFGKGIIDEGLDNFCGIYTGFAGNPTLKDRVDNCDLILRFGPLNSEINTFGSSAMPNPQVTITFENDSVHFGHSFTKPGLRRKLSLRSMLQKILRHLDPAKLPRTDRFPTSADGARTLLQCSPAVYPDKQVDQKTFWPTMSTFLRPNDIVMTETGTASYGGQSLILPNNITIVNSSIWLSIGYMLAACQGAALAQREMVREGTRPQGRTILFEGDGSLQMTAQAISDIIRNELDVIIFVLNNNGNTIERIIHGPRAPYNNAQPWRNLEAAKYLGAPESDSDYSARTRMVNNWGALKQVLNDPEIQAGRGFTMIEIAMDTDEAPAPLIKFVEYLTARNSGQL